MYSFNVKKEVYCGGKSVKFVSALIMFYIYIYTVKVIKVLCHKSMFNAMLFFIAFLKRRSAFHLEQQLKSWTVLHKA